MRTKEGQQWVGSEQLPGSGGGHGAHSGPDRRRLTSGARCDSSGVPRPMQQGSTSPCGPMTGGADPSRLEPCRWRDRSAAPVVRERTLESQAPPRRPRRLESRASPAADKDLGPAAKRHSTGRRTPRGQGEGNRPSCDDDREPDRHDVGLGCHPLPHHADQQVLHPATSFGEGQHEHSSDKGPNPANPPEEAQPSTPRAVGHQENRQESAKKVASGRRRSSDRIPAPGGTSGDPQWSSSGRSRGFSGAVCADAGMSSRLAAESGAGAFGVELGRQLVGAPLEVRGEARVVGGVPSLKFGDESCVESGLLVRHRAAETR